MEGDRRVYGLNTTTTLWLEKLVYGGQVDKSFVGVKCSIILKLTLHLAPTALAYKVPRLCLLFPLTYAHCEVTVADGNLIELVYILRRLDEHHTGIVPEEGPVRVRLAIMVEKGCRNV